MEKHEIRRLITQSIIKEIVKTDGQRFIPVAISARHVHLSKNDLAKLFGSDHQLKIYKELSQPGQYAAVEKIDVVGPNNEIKDVRILGPARKTTQIELAASDCRRLGIEPILRMSGDISNTSGATLIGPAGKIEITEGIIVAKNHIHISNKQAEMLALNNGEHVDVEKLTGRRIAFMDVVVRVDNAFDLEMHIDTDEANAGLIKNGELLRIRNRRNDEI